jgi:hypothetical protein
MRRLVFPLLTVALVACQAQPVTLLDDPDEILAAAVKATSEATSVHVDLTAEGTVTVDVLGTGIGTSLDLAGTTAAADIDLKNGELRATFSAPGLLGVAGEVIVADGTAYVKSTLTGPKYRSTPVGQSTETPLAGLTDLLARTDLDPTKGADAPCAGGTCYTIELQLTADDVGGMLGGAIPPGLAGLPIPIPDLSDATADVTIQVEQTTNRLSGVTAELHLGDLGDPTIAATFSKWNEAVQVAPPPADQVEPAG